jgi:hypothetical protein
MYIIPGPKPGMRYFQIREICAGARDRRDNLPPLDKERDQQPESIWFSRVEDVWRCLIVIALQGAAPR